MALASAAGITSGERRQIQLLKIIAKVGISAVLKKRGGSAGKISALIDEFLIHGAKAVLKTGAQRGGDFLNNQLRGQCAERVTLSLALEQSVLVQYGPSGAAMPGEDDHREIIMTFREITLIEGKRPDLLVFGSEQWRALSPAEQSAVATWPTRRLSINDRYLIAKAKCGIEVKNSTWHYSKRRGAGPAPLSITVKDEELDDLSKWSNQTSLPIVFMQVLFD